MKTHTTIKLQWDNGQHLNRVCSELSIIRQEKMTHDLSVRFLIDFWDKNKAIKVKEIKK